MREKFDVIGIGTSGIDIISTPEGRLECPGGAVANSIVALARLGLNTGYIGRGGKNKYGKMIVSAFTKEGVDLSRFRIDDGPTARFLITLTSHKRILKGAQSYVPIKQFTEEDRRYSQKSRSLLFRAKPDLLEFYLSLKKQPPLYIIFPFIKPKKIPLPLIKKAKPQAIFSNEEEFRAFKRDLGSLTKEGITVVVTRGRRGCRIYSKKRAMDYDGYKVKALDPTGAGDAFAAGFVFGDLNVWGEEEKARFANAMGALATTAYGARGKLPTLRGVQEFMEKRERK